MPNENLRSRITVNPEICHPAQEDWLKVLAECPVPMDDIPRRRRELPKKRRL